MSNYGFIPIEEIRNCRTEFMRVLDEDCWPISDPTPSRVVVLAHFESLFFELERRAKHNLEEATKRNQIGVHTDIRKRTEEDESAKKNREEWKKRTAMGREYAKSPEGK